MRKPIIAGNWKMHKVTAESKEFVNELMAGLKEFDKAILPEVVVAPVFTALQAVSDAMCACGCGKVKLSAQNCYFEKQGAYTGEVSVEMIKDLKAEYVIIGHSERRQYFSETNEMVNKKAKAILSNGLIPIICCGETIEQRQQGLTDSHIDTQIRAALEGLTADEVAKSAIAYEPIWAIGTGETCDSVEANRVIAMIRSLVADIVGKEAADAVRILYGGSVKPDTIEEQMSQSDIDGALVGGASLKISDFLSIITGTMKVSV